jgi:Uma2 family endonuclease
MATVMYEDTELEIPSWVTDLTSFRKWVDDPAFPEDVNVWWLRGKVWADMSKEQAFWHNRVRTRITSALDRLVEETDSGVLWSEGMFLVNEAGDIAGIPDLMFVSHEALADGRAMLIEGRDGGTVEVHGTPQMVLEAVSKSSVKKDTRDLFEAYWQAGIPEYWLVDARTTPLRFDIYRHTTKGYVATRKRDGWLRSNVFDKSFQLVETTDRSGLHNYKLEVR